MKSRKAEQKKPGFFKPGELNREAFRGEGGMALEPELPPI
jgi:hypothetical protein